MKTISLTFDDGLESHHDFVLPLLKENGCKGTFFITSLTNMWSTGIGDPEMKEKAVNFDKLIDFEEAGMELGNHTQKHPDLRTYGNNKIRETVKKVYDNIFLPRGLKKPITFCYPGYQTDSRVVEVIKSLGFTHARTGYIDTGTHQSQINSKVKRPPVSYYPDDNESPLLIRPTGIVNDVYRFPDFVKDIEAMPDNAYAVFVFHGLKKPSRADDFIKIINYIVKNNISAINFKDLPI